MGFSFPAALRLMFIISFHIISCTPSFPIYLHLSPSALSPLHLYSHHFILLLFPPCPGYSRYRTYLQFTSLRQPKMQIALIVWTTFLFLSAGLSPHGFPSLSSGLCKLCSWLDLDRFILGVHASNVGALAEDVDKSVDNAFPAAALADGGLIVVSGQSGHSSESFTMPQCW